MKFVTLPAGPENGAANGAPNSSPDGRLYIASRDGKWATPAAHVATLQAALETWQMHASSWQAQFDALNAGTLSEAIALDQSDALSPLPRAWQWLDGSAFETHMLLMQKAWGLPEAGLSARPLMYQGLSDRFLPPTADAVFPSAGDGIDFEGEYGVIVGAVPMGTKASEAAQHIRLIVQINDWSLRGIGPTEMATGFGWLQCKPACSVAPLAVTPDELGEDWRECRVCLPLHVQYNEAGFGQTNGDEMKFGFDELVAHAAYSRDLPAGTIIGSGTVSNQDYRTAGSSCIAERRAIETIDTGESQTPFMTHGDTVRMYAQDASGGKPFGQIAQTVVVTG